MSVTIVTVCRMWQVFLLLSIFIASCCSSTVQKRSSRVCYGDLGCFSNDGPFFDLTHRPLTFLPDSPQQINPSFTVFTRQQPATGHQIHSGDARSVLTSGFKAARPTKVIVHGFIDNGDAGWMRDMKDALLGQGDYNVVEVNWAVGAMALYGQATANTRVVGAMLAQIITFLQTVTGQRPEHTHVIGHSLGAHVAGYAGQRLRYLGRISGLDPAEPYFQYTDKEVRLDPTDALFVDVIHTDGDSFFSPQLGYGMMEACGHVDYYPNGGHNQPGCEKGAVSHLVTEGLVTGTKEFVACNHLRAYHFFTESINSTCPFEGYRCPSEDSFNAGSCLPCSDDGCGLMGLHADQVKPQPGQSPVKYYLNTGSSSPYCRWHYKVSLTFAGTVSTAQEESGQLYLRLTGHEGATHEVQVTHSAEHFHPGNTYTYIVTSPADLGDITQVSFRWTHQSQLLDVTSWNVLWLRHPTLYVDEITVANGEDHTTFSFCEESSEVETGQLQVFSSRC